MCCQIRVLRFPMCSLRFPIRQCVSFLDPFCAFPDPRVTFPDLRLAFPDPFVFPFLDPPAFRFPIRPSPFPDPPETLRV